MLRAIAYIIFLCSGIFLVFPAPSAYAIMYAPGATLAPSCAPTDLNCGVTTDGSLTVATGNTLTLTDITPGSVTFAGTSGVVSQDNANLFWDNTNNRLGIGTSTPAHRLDVTGAINYTGTLYQNGVASNPFLTDGSNNIWSSISGTPSNTDSFLVGYLAGQGSTGAEYSNFIGNSAGNGATDASDSNFFGNNAGNGATNADNSNFFGDSAGYNAANAYYSNFLGFDAGNGATNANNSNFLGVSAGYGATTANNSNFSGNNAGNGATNANNSNLLGRNAGFSATNASFSNFLGYGAGYQATSAAYSNFLGNSAGNGATGATYSNFLGNGAGQDATSASFSNFLGNGAGQSATNASFSNFLGNGAGYQATNAANSNFFGKSAGYNAANAYYSNFLGYSAGHSATDATDSNFLGRNAGLSATNASYSNFLGTSAGNDATNANDSNFLGYNAGHSATGANNSNFFGTSAGQSATNASFSNFLGNGAGYQATNATNSNFFGESAGYNATDANNSNFLGVNAGNSATNASNSNFLGTSAGNGATNASRSNFLGYNAGNGAAAASYSNFLGYSAGYQATNATNSNFFGESAGYNATDATDSNFLGRNAGLSATNASNSNFLGYSAGNGATNAYKSNFLGYFAGVSATNAKDSIFLGSYAGSNDTVNNTANSGASIAIGRYSGTGGFSNSIALGRGIINSAAQQLNIGNVLYATGIYNSDTQSASPNGGFVGIGTVTPGSTLDVKGTLRLSGATSGFVGFAPAAAAGSTTYTLPSADGTSGQVLSTNASGVLSWAAAGGSSQWTTSGSKIYYNTGNVGIGTNDPVDKLQVGDGTADFRLSVMSNTTKQFTAKNATGNSVKYGASTDSLPNAVISNNDDTALMTLLYGGNVGIGATTPSSRLDVRSLNLGVDNGTGNGGVYFGTTDSFGTNIGGTMQLGGSAGDDSKVSFGSVSGRKENGTINNFAGYLQLATNGAGGGMSEKVRITSTGNVGIGITTPADLLQVFGDVRLGTTGTNGCIKNFAGTGITGTCSSDERLKTNVVNLSDDYLDRMNKLNVITYNWNESANTLNKVDTSVTNYGLLAQNVEQFFPELVTVDSNGYKQVDYSRLPLYLLKSLQELTKKIIGFADEFRTKKLCVGDTCITESEFAEMVSRAGQTPPPSSAVPAAALPPPVPPEETEPVVVEPAPVVVPVVEIPPIETPPVAEIPPTENT